MRSPHILLPALLAAALSLSAARADDWAQWRGPLRDGTSREKGLLPQWPQSGPKLLWQIKDAGAGYGSVAVAGGKLFLTGNEGLDDEFVQARDARDGKLLWRTRLGKVGNPDQQPSYPGSRTTPTVDGALLYVLGSDGDLLCLQTATGKVRWKKSLRADFGGAPGTWAYSESPLVDGDAVVVTPGGPTATLVALNKRTGAPLWKCAIPDGGTAAYASTVVARIGGVKQYVQFLQNALVGVDAATGKLLWRFERTADSRSGGNIGTPLVIGDTVYSSAGLVGGGLARIRRDGGAFAAEAVYFERALPNAIGGVVRVGDHLYGASGSTWMCVDAATGAVKWQERGAGAGSMVYADGRLYVRRDAGEVVLLEPTPDGYREKGKFTPPEHPKRGRPESWAYPALANGRLYVRDLGMLWCYDVRAPRAAQR